LIITKNGPKAIDAFNMKIGSLAFGGSLDWAPSEQLLKEPLTAASDVYSLSLLVIKLLKTIIHGEIREYIIPANDNEEIITVLANPKVFVSEKASLLKVNK